MEAEEVVKRVKELQQSKERLIFRYLELQDQADALNERIYDLCCHIETINQQIVAEEEKALQNGIPLNGALKNGSAKVRAAGDRP